MIQAPPPVISLAVESSAESEIPRQAVIGNSLDSFNVVKPNRTNRPVRRLVREPASNQAKPARQAARLGSVATAARLQIKPSGKGKQESWTVKTTTKPSTKGSKQTSFRVRVSDVGLVGLGALLISTLATLYPSVIASRIEPAEGLKVQS